MMIGLGQIPTIGNTTARSHEMRLFREVEKVDEKEAEQGALHSDGLRLNSREKDSRILTRSGLSDKLSKFWKTLKTKRSEPEKKTGDEDCPVDKARAQSAVGQNAPLGWLTLDHLFRDGNGPATGGADSYVEKSQADSVSSSESTELSFLRADPDDADYLFNDEWFLSPCG